MDITPTFTPERLVSDKTLTIKLAPPLLAPDRELLEWERWVQIRHEETTKLANKLNKQPVDLAMNLLDKVRPDIEQKTALVNAQLEEKVKVRGGATWERPPRLKQPCDHCCPAYEIKRTKAERGNPGVIQHIGVPTLIKQKELGMAGQPQRKSSFHLDAEYKSYRKKREKELEENMKKIVPHKPFMGDLIVRGKKPPAPPPKIPRVPFITIDFIQKEQEKPLASVYAIKINDYVLRKRISGPNSVFLPEILKEDQDPKEVYTSWTYYFNVPVKRAGRSQLYLENLGTVALRYCWKKIRRVVPVIPQDHFEKVLFFNKNEDIISPGQKKEIFFTFICDNPGIYSEAWELYLNDMQVFDDLKDKLSFIFYADAVEELDRVTHKVEILKTRIYGKAVNSIATELVNEIFDNVFVVPKELYPYEHFFAEEQTFLSKNPVCFYHQTDVQEMKEQYKEMYKLAKWDLSINSWRSAMMCQEYNKRMEYYKMLRKFHSELLKPWSEEVDLVKEKHRMIRILLEDLFDKFDKEYTRVREMFSDEVHPTRTVSTKAMRRKSRMVIPVCVDTPAPASHNAKMIFYLRIYEHISNTIELCAGVLGSMDLNRWIDFNFCE